MANPFPEIPFQTQLDFLWSELQGPEKKTLEAFQSGGYVTPQDYAEAFEKLFERSKGSALDKRRQYALEVFKGMEDPLNPQGLSQNAAIAYNYLLNKGLNPPQASGIVGNLMAESFGSIDPAAYNPSGGGQGALGIAQWRGPRLESLLKFAGMNGEKPMVQSTFGSGVPTAGTIFPQQQKKQGLQGLLQQFMQPNETTGLTGPENFAQALDALILPEARMGEQIRARGAQRLAQGSRNETIKQLERMAKNGDPLAAELLAAVKSGAISPADAYKTLLAQKYDTKGDTIRSSVKFKNGSYYVITDKGRKVYDTQGNLVPDGPKAAEVLREAELSGIAMEGYGAGAVEQAKFQQKYADELFGKAAQLTENIGTIDEAIKQIDEGARTGPVLQFLPNITPASSALETALTRMGLDVISTVTFGALSEGEMRAAMATAYPQNLNEQDLRQWLVDRKNGLQKLRKYSEEAGIFLSNPMNTRADWVTRMQERRDQKNAASQDNPYMRMTKEQLNVEFTKYNEMTEVEKAQFTAALRSKSKQR